jgi:hypothetical protein
MQHTPERWAALCAKVKETQEETAHTLAESYKSYQNAKKNYEDTLTLVTTNPEIQANVESIKARCKEVLEVAEHNLQKCMRNMERANLMVHETEHLASIVTEYHKN